MKAVAIFLSVIFCVCFTAVAQQKSADKRMPMNEETLSQFADKLAANAKKIEAGSADEWTKTILAKKSIEEMGYNFEKTFVYFVIKIAPTGSRTSTQLLQYFGQPLYNPDEAIQKKFISDKTRGYLKVLNAAPSGTGEDVAALLHLQRKYGTNLFSQKQVFEGLSELQKSKKLKGELAELTYTEDAGLLWQRIEYNLTANASLNEQIKFKRGDDGGQYLELLDVGDFKKAAASQQELKKLTAEMEAFIN